jgi:hypothetical protein
MLLERCNAGQVELSEYEKQEKGINQNNAVEVVSLKGNKEQMKG